MEYKLLLSVDDGLLKLLNPTPLYLSDSIFSVSLLAVMDLY
jgi:hypothetical protein